MQEPTRPEPSKKQDVVIIGGGVTGTALLYNLAQNTNIDNITLIEKYEKISPLNSNRRSNSQTLHFGDIETNIGKEKARQVNQDAQLILNYIAQLPLDEQQRINTKYHKMVLAVGEKEIHQLTKRFEEIKDIFPQLRLIHKDEIQALEPSIINPARATGKQPIAALYTPNGYAVDFGELAKNLVEKAQHTTKNIELLLGTKVLKITKHTEHYEVVTDKKTITTKTVVVSAGAHSLLFAHAMGYGKEYATLPIQGSFYHTPKVLNGKVYTVQNDKLPFAAIHGDPDLDSPDTTRFGPTALAIPFLEKGNPRTFLEFVKTLSLDGKVVKTLIRIMQDRDMRNFLLKNLLFKLPLLGKRVFLKEARKIVPGLANHELTYNRDLGGVRPQVLDKKNLKFLMGEARIDHGDGIIFNMTPSPGASVCMKNAVKDTESLQKYLDAQIKQL